MEKSNIKNKYIFQKAGVFVIIVLLLISACVPVVGSIDYKTVDSINNVINIKNNQISDDKDDNDLVINNLELDDPLPLDRDPDDPPTFYEDSGRWYIRPSSYDELVSWYLNLEQNFSDYIDVFKANELYGTGTVPKNGGGSYDLYYVRVTNESRGFHKPEVLFSGGPHGNEKIGAIGLYWSLDWLMRHAFHPDYDCPERDYLQWLLDNREIYIDVFLNPDGFDRNVRGDYLGRDLNREGDHDASWGPFDSVNGQTLMRFVNNHTLRTATWYHSGGRELLYPWQSEHSSISGTSPITGRSHCNAPADFYYFDASGLHLGDYIGDYGGDLGSGEVGSSCSQGYGGPGVLTSWGYGANNLSHPLEDSYVELGPHLGAGILTWDPEADEVHNPGESTFGNDTTARFGAEVRRLLIFLSDIAQPSVHWTDEHTDTYIEVDRGSDLNLSWLVHGCLVVDHTYIQWGSDPDPINYPDSTTTDYDIYAGEYYGGSYWDDAEDGNTTPIVYSEELSFDTPGDYYVVAKAMVDQVYDNVLRSDYYGEDSYLRMIEERTNASFYEALSGTDGLEEINGQLWWYSPIVHIRVRNSEDHWYNNSWSYRKDITIDHTKLDDNLVDFPILLNISDNDLDEKAQSNGNDIIFIDSDGVTKLNHEIEYYDEGNLTVWVKIPILQSNSDKTIYMYYGNSSAPNQENVSGVWDSNFVMVQHLDETTDTHYDSTSYDNDGSPNGGVIQDALGQIDGADEFDGTDDYVEIPHNDNLTGFTESMTASAWVKLDQISTRQTIMNKYNTSNNQRGWAFDFIIESGTGFGYVASEMGETGSWVAYTYSHATSTDTWYYVTVVWESDKVPKMYVDGVEISTSETDTVSSIYNNNLEPLIIGRAYPSATPAPLGRYWDGIIDEACVSNIARSEGWITTSYNNQNNPNDFYEISREKGPIIIFNPSPSNNSINIPTDTSSLSFNLTHIQGKHISYIVETYPDIGSADVSDVSNGRYTVPVTGIEECTLYTWWINVTDGINETKEVYVFNSECNNPWWNEDWLYRKEITIDHSKVEEDLTDFPLLIELSDSDLESKAQIDGDDIVFVDYSGVKLDYEIEYYNEGNVVAWVNIPLLSSTINTTINIYYGNLTTGNQENPEGVWDSNFVMVQHLDETTGTHYDSTSYDNDGSPNGGVIQDALGQIDGADEFDGTDDYVEIPHDDNLTGFTESMTASAWVKFDDVSIRRAIISKYNSAGSQRSWNFEYINNDASGPLSLQLTASSNGIDFSSWNGWNGDLPPTTDTWYYVVVCWESNEQPTFYLNGDMLEIIDVSGSNLAQLYNNDLEPLKIGGTYNTARYWDGMIDEARVSKIARSEGWIKTNYNNQYDPDSFFDVGLEQNVFGNFPPKLSDEDPLDDMIDVSINQATVSVNIEDPEGDNFDWTIEGEYINNAAGYSASNGSKSATIITPLPFVTQIIWYINVTDTGTGLTIKAIYSFTTEMETITWYDTDWNYRRMITINHSEVMDSFTYFPVLVDIQNESIGTYAKTNGDDFVFSNDTGVKLDHEIEYYNNTEGHLVAWVNVTDLSSTGDTIILLYYGNPSIGNQQNPSGVWDSNYMMVHHLNETSGSHYDSTSNNNDGTPENGVVQDASGQIDGANHFDGTDDYVNIPHADTLAGFTENFTASMWVKTDTTGPRRGFLCKYQTTGNQRSYNIESPGTDANSIQLTASAVGTNVYAWWKTDFSPATDTWYYITVCWASDELPTFYINGEKSSITGGSNNGGTAGKDTISQFYNNDLTPLYIGGSYDSNRFWDGGVDEVRISNVNRSAEWIKTCYNNQKSPIDFLYIQSEESAPLSNNPPIFSNEIPLNQSINIDILQSLVNATIEDPDGDSFDWSIEGFYVNDASGTDDVNGSKTANLIAPLPYDTVIVWYVNASDGTDTTKAVYDFTTRAQYLPNPPTDFTATAVSRTQIDLAWNPDSIADTTYIERNSIASWSRGDGTEIYNDSGSSYSDIGLSEGTQYFYQAWSWNNTDHIFSSSYAADDATTLENLAPVLSFEEPVDDSVDIDISQSTVNVTISDPEGDPLDWTIEGVYINDASGTDETNGSKTASLINPFPYDTVIVWYVNASDGTDTTEAIYDFTTRSQYLPNPPTDFTATAVSRTQIDLAWNPDSIADTTYIERNSIPSWTMGDGTEVYNSSGSSYSDSSLTEGTQYYYQAWSWNNTDHIFSSSYASDDATTLENLAPVLSFEEPVDDSVDVDINQASVNVTISDPEGDPLDWTIEGVYINDAIGTDEANGSKQTTLITPLPYYTDIIWYVNASDGTDSIEAVYNFKTIVPSLLLVDSEFDDSVDSADLRANDTSQDWYESRDEDPTLLTLNITDVGGNSGKKAALKNYGIALNSYLDQEFSYPQTGTFNISYDIFIDRIEDSGDYDRSAYIWLGDDSDTTPGRPCSTSNERFVYLTFYDSTPGDTGDDLELRAREYNTPAQPWATTSTWTPVATDLSYDTWYTIYLEVNVSDGTYDVYVNGVLKGDDINKYENYAGSSITDCVFSVGSNEKGDFFVDNVFSPTSERHKLTLDVIGSGSISADPSESTYADGTSVELNAVPDSGYTFIGWSSDLSGDNNPETILMDDDKNIVATFSDIVPPEIENVMATPSSTFQGGFINITCDVSDNVDVDTVKVDITGPTGFTPVNTTMTGGSYYYNTSYTFAGTYDFFIWANDTSDNHNMSTGHSFTVVSSGGPIIVDNSDDSAFTGDSFVVNATITDSDGIAGVWLEYWFNSGSKTYVSMTNTAGDYYEYDSISIPLDSLDSLYYNISAKDNYDVWSYLNNQEVTILDNINPVIENVATTPSSTPQGGFINITCDVSDNVGVDTVKVDITGPTGFTPVNVTMNVGSYYYNTSYTVPGTYNYFIWASDTSDNSVISSTYMFSIQQGILLADSEFDDSVDSADLRANVAGQDWYESRGSDPTKLTLDTSVVDGNSGKKASLKYYGTGGTSYAYLTQNFTYAQYGIFNVSFDINIDRIEDDGDIDRTGYIYIGDDSAGTNGPCSTSAERFVLLAFYDASPGDTGSDLELRAREYNTPSQPWAETSTWTSVATDLSYDTWYTVRLEIDVSSGTYDVYIDDVLEGDDVSKYEQYISSSVTDISFSTGVQGIGDFFVDNVFAPASDRHRLTLDVVGSGSISADPSESTYANGDSVELTAVPDSGWGFVSWSGDHSGSNNPDTITITNDMSITAIFSDIEPPEIMNVLTSPSLVFQGDYLNISCDVSDNVGVDTVKVDITGPTGFTPVNATMTKGSYYYNASYNEAGTYDFFIWANDTYDNRNMSKGHTFNIMTSGSPVIVDNSADSAYTGDSFIVNASVTDSDGIAGVWLEYWFNSGSKTYVSMDNTAGDYYEYDSISIPLDSLDILYYNISTKDNYDVWSYLNNQEVTILDNIDPVIENVAATPSSTASGGFVNITCDVSDNVDVDMVKVDISGPTGFTHVNVTMSEGSYYYNTSYSLPGTYDYFIWAKDTSDNSNISASYQFTIIGYDDVLFNSSFEMGNLINVLYQNGDADGKRYYTAELNYSMDTFSDKFWWFHFSMENTNNKEITVELQNLPPQDFGIGGGLPRWQTMEPVYSYDYENWLRVPLENISWDSTALNFSMTIKPSEDKIWLANIPPYTLTMRDNLIDEYASSPYIETYSLGTTPLGFELKALNITDPSIPDAGKNKVYIISQQHSGEGVPSYVTEGMIRFLLDETNSTADILRKYCIFKIIPIVNVEGVYYGVSRYTPFRDGDQHDLNRQWNKAIDDMQPEINWTFSEIQSWNPDVFMDLHDDSVTEDCFFYKGGTHASTYYLMDSIAEYWPETDTSRLTTSQSAGQVYNRLGIYPSVLMEHPHDGRTSTTKHPTDHNPQTIDDWMSWGVGIARGLFDFFDLTESPILLVDSEFDDSVDSVDLRNDDTDQDWYESKGENPSLLTLNVSDVGGNSGKKSAIKTYDLTADNYVYLTQEFNIPQTSSFNVSMDIYVDSIQTDFDIGASHYYNRTGYIYIGDDSQGTDGPCSTSVERFVFLTFYDNTPGDTGDDLELRARELDYHSSGASQSWHRTNEWTQLASDLSYDTWYTIRLEVDVSSGTYDVYIDDVLVGEDVNGFETYASPGFVEYISFSGGYQGKGDFFVDNVFSPASDRYRLTIDVVGSGSISVDPGESTYANDTSVELTAIPDTGWSFDSWSGDLSGSVNPENILMDDDKTITATFVDITPPEITNVLATPPATSQGGFINITCDVFDSVGVDTVKVDITGPTGFTPVNATMTEGSYYYNASYDEAGTYYFFIWANDTSDNRNMSTGYSFNIMTSGAPIIVDNSADSAFTGDSFIVNATVTDSDGIAGVWLEYWFDSGSKTYVSMVNTAGDYYEYDSISIPLDSLDSLFYNISAKDNFDVWSYLNNQEVTILDNILPTIENVAATPSSTNQGGFVNISCDVSDNVGVDMVKVDITGPTGFTPINTTMTEGSYYYNASYIVPGTYDYFIWAKDTSDNSKTSATYQFIIIGVDDIIFNSSFEMGNLKNVTYQTGDPSGNRYYKAEVNYSTISFPDKHWWFYYSMENTIGKTITIELHNLSSEDFNDTSGDLPRWPDVEPVYSYDNIHWSRVPLENISWNETGLNFTITIEPTENKVWLAPIPPYTVTMRDNLFSEYSSSPYLSISSLGTTPLGQEVTIATITDPTIPEEDKDKIYIIAQQHSGETVSSFVAEGMIRFLLDETDDTASYVRENCTFKIIPIANPEGVFYGISRYTPFRGGNQYDPNRAWDDDLGTMLATCPETRWIFDDIQSWQPDVFIDMHSEVNGENYNEDSEDCFFLHDRLYDDVMVRLCDNISTGADGTKDYWPETGSRGGSGTSTAAPNVRTRLGVHPSIAMEHPHDNRRGTLQHPVDHNPQTTDDWKEWGLKIALGLFDFFQGDDVSPVVSDVGVLISDPVDTDVGWENISCTVVDNVEVGAVYLNLTYPDMHTESLPMINSGDTYYYNTTLSDVGSYSYSIWALDTSGNSNVSVVDSFVIPPNWDINVDHDCSIVDLILVANHFDESGDNGWIREDVNNDGDISVLDLVLLVNHFDETW